MDRRLVQTCRLIALVIAGFACTGHACGSNQEARFGPRIWNLTVGTDIHHDRSPAAARHRAFDDTPRHRVTLPLGIRRWIAALHLSRSLQ